MKDRESQRVALVTGGAVRVGRAISVGLAAAGHDLVVAYHASADAAEEVRSTVAALGRRCETVRADLSEPSAAEEVVDAARNAYGRLDLVVNSAASFRAQRLLDVDAEEWDRVMALNARAPHLIVRAAADLLRASRGSVINIVDLSAHRPWTSHPHHAVSKAALAHLTRVQARALAPHVRVNAIAPGAVLRPEELSEERWQALGQAAPLRRVGSPDDVVQAVRYLATAEFVTGQVLAVDGGSLLVGRSGT